MVWALGPGPIAFGVGAALFFRATSQGLYFSQSQNPGAPLPRATDPGGRVTWGPNGADTVGPSGTTSWVPLSPQPGFGKKNVRGPASKEKQIGAAHRETKQKHGARI